MGAQSKVWDMFKVISEGTRTTSLGLSIFHFVLVFLLLALAHECRLGVRLLYVCIGGFGGYRPRGGCGGEGYWALEMPGCWGVSHRILGFCCFLSSRFKAVWELARRPVHKVYCTRYPASLYLW